MQRRQGYAKRARFIKALGHPSRPMTVGVLVNGEVIDRKQGPQASYRHRVPCISQFFGCVEAVLDADREAPSCSTA